MPTNNRFMPSMLITVSLICGSSAGDDWDIHKQATDEEARFKVALLIGGLAYVGTSDVATASQLQGLREERDRLLATTWGNRYRPLIEEIERLAPPRGERKQVTHLDEATWVRLKRIAAAFLHWVPRTQDPSARAKIVRLVHAYASEPYDEEEHDLVATYTSLFRGNYRQITEAEDQVQPLTSEDTAAPAAVAGTAAPVRPARLRPTSTSDDKSHNQRDLAAKPLPRDALGSSADIGRRCDEALELARTNKDRARQLLLALTHEESGNPSPYVALGDLCILAHDSAQATRWYTEALRRNPRLVECYGARASAYEHCGEYGKAHADYLAGCNVTGQVGLAFANNYAWFLATCPERRWRDGERAVQFATACVEATKPASCDYATRLDTLAAAYAEVGHFEEAQRWQLKALALVDKKNGSLVDAMQGHSRLYASGRPCHTGPEPVGDNDLAREVLAQRNGTSSRALTPAASLTSPDPVAPAQPKERPQAASPGPAQTAGTAPRAPAANTSTDELAGTFGIGMVAIGIFFIMVILKALFGNSGTPVTPAIAAATPARTAAAEHPRAANQAVRSERGLSDAEEEIRREMAQFAAARRY